MLPTYDVFDEARYFNPGEHPLVFTVTLGGTSIRVGVTICEDLWNNRQFDGRRVYAADPIARSVEAGAELLVNLSASPFRAEIETDRLRLFGAQARNHNLPIAYVNQCAGHDDLVFDGASMVLDRAGRIVARAKAFEEDLLIVDLECLQKPLSPVFGGEGRVRGIPNALEGPPHGTYADPPAARIEPYPDRLESVRAALVLGIRDYVRKCGFSDVCLGLSGGIDSALTAALAVDALGRGHVHAIALPSRFTSPQSIEDARRLADNLAIDFRTIAIESAHEAFERSLADAFTGRAPDATEENLQARIRGNLLMALCNKFGWLLLSTGNKSELAVGYCTLYGDMCGALGVLGDVWKTTVYQLAERINRDAGRELIPRRTIERVPTAELRENQTDQDTLPPYDLLDTVLERYVERGDSVEQIIGRGFKQEVVEWIARAVYRAEYKRKQAPVILKVSRRAFGAGWRAPIAAAGR